MEDRQGQGLAGSQEATGLAEEVTSFGEEAIEERIAGEKRSRVSSVAASVAVIRPIRPDGSPIAVVTALRA